MALTLQEQQQFNREIQSWGRNSKTKLAYAIARLNLRSRLDLEAGQTHLIKSLKVKFKKDQGRIYATIFQFQRQGIFVEYGVGRGRGIGSGKEKPRPWIIPTLPSQIETLADIVSEKYADIISETKLFAPGITKFQKIT